MLLEKRQSLGIESSIHAPIAFSKCPVVFLRLVDNSEFIQLMREGSVGIYMVKISIVTSPVKLESSERFDVVGVLGNHGFQIEVIAKALHESGIDDQPIPFLAPQQIDEQRWFVRIGQMSLKHRGKDLCSSIFFYIIHGFGIHQNIPFGYCRTDPDTGSSTHRVHGIDRAKDIRMPHTEADSSISSDENSGNAS